MKRRSALQALSLAISPATALACPSAVGRACTTLIVPHAPGGAGDRVARVFAAQWRAADLGAIVVINKPGGGGAVAIRALARAPKDGTVLFLGSTGTEAVLPLTAAGSRLPRPTPLLQLSSTAGVLVAAPTMHRGLEVILSQARTLRHRLSFGSAGVGSLGHLAMEALADQWNIPLAHIPYKSGPEVVSDLLAGRVHLSILNVGDALPLILARRLHPLAITGSPRHVKLPAIPTFTEIGVEAADIEAWQGLFLPPATAPAVVMQMEARIQPLIRSETFRRALVRAGVDPVDSSVDTFSSRMTNQQNRVRRLVQSKGIRLE